jgi:hypothetical protein
MRILFVIAAIGMAHFQIYAAAPPALQRNILTTNVVTLGSGLSLSVGNVLSSSGGSASFPLVANADGNNFSITNLAGLSVNGSGANAMDALVLTNSLMMLNVTAGKIAIYDALKNLTNSALAITDLAPLADPIFTGSLQLPNGAAPTTDAFGEIAGDNNIWGVGRGAVQFYDGTANTYLVGVLASDTPANGQVPTWNTGGTITWETPTGGSGGATTTTQTNFVLNTVYTNGTQTVLARATAALTGAAVNGDSAIDLMVDQAGGSTFALLARTEISTAALGLAIQVTNDITAVLVPLATYYWTNSSSGSGNSAVIVGGTGQTVTISSGTNGVGSGSSDNWSSSGTTNSTLAGVGSANQLIGTNGLFGPYNSTTAGNTLRTYKYIQLFAPRLTDGTGATLNIATSTSSSGLSGQATFSASAATNANYAAYFMWVPTDIDTTVEMTADFAESIGADTNQRKYSIAMYSPAASAVRSNVQTACSNYILFNSPTDAAGAASDVEYTTGITLTGWAAAMVPGQYVQIMLARDGAGDSSSVASSTMLLSIRYMAKSQ